MRPTLAFLVAASLTSGPVSVIARQDATPPEERASVPAALDFKMKDIDGKEVNLAQYKGRVVLMVNVASRCGFTPQYQGLEQLHQRFYKKGLVVLGFPANNFRGQEPGTDEEIKEFCTNKYDVHFQMFSKVSVKGEDICPLYKLLTDTKKTPASEGEINWNFEKFLLSADGEVVKHYRSRTTPEMIVEDIEALLVDAIPPKEDEKTGWLPNAEPPALAAARTRSVVHGPLVTAESPVATATVPGQSPQDQHQQRIATCEDPAAGMSTDYEWLAVRLTGAANRVRTSAGVTRAGDRGSFLGACAHPLAR